MSTERKTMSHLIGNIRRQINVNAVRQTALLKLALRFCLLIIICLPLISQIFLPATALAASTEPSKSTTQTKGDYLLDREITWADGSKERVQIGEDGFFRLDNEKKSLVGMYLSTQLPYGEPGQFWLPENLQILDKELNYLESIGVRLIRIDLRYVRWWLKDTKEEEEAYTTLLDLIYTHKMLLIPGLHAKWMPGFGDLANPNPDFKWSLQLPERITDPGFEDAHVNAAWSNYYQNSTPAFLYPAPGRNGGLCAGIELPPSKSDQPPMAMWLQDIPVQAGKSYPVGGWVKTENIDGGGGVMIMPTWKGPGNTWIGATKFMSYVKGTGDWKYYQGVVTAPEGATICTLSLVMEGCSGKAWFDDIVFGLGEGTTDSLGEWAVRWSSIVSRYQNVVAVNADNELDYKLQPQDFPGDPYAEIKTQKYTADMVGRHMSFLTGIIRKKVNAPITHNLMLNNQESTIKEVCLSHVDIPAFDCYANTTKTLDADLKNFNPSAKGKPGWWCLELNYGGMENINGVTQWDINIDKFSADYIDTVFKNGASVAILFWSSDVANAKWGFFDERGVPKVQLAEVSGRIDRLQAAISDATPLLARIK
jgi:hypothetical protein